MQKSLMKDKGSAQKVRFVVCVKNRGFAASLEVRKVYRVVPDPAAESHGLLRVIDESGEDYLFPESCFVALDLPIGVVRAIFNRRPGVAIKRAVRDENGRLST